MACPGYPICSAHIGRKFASKISPIPPPCRSRTSRVPSSSSHRAWPSRRNPPGSIGRICRIHGRRIYRAPGGRGQAPTTDHPQASAHAGPALAGGLPPPPVP